MGKHHRKRKTTSISTLHWCNIIPWIGWNGRSITKHACHSRVSPVKENIPIWETRCVQSPGVPNTRSCWWSFSLMVLIRSFMVIRFSNLHEQTHARSQLHTLVMQPPLSLLSETSSKYPVMLLSFMLIFLYLFPYSFLPISLLPLPLVHSLSSLLHLSLKPAPTPPSLSQASSKYLVMLSPFTLSFFFLSLFPCFLLPLSSSFSLCPLSPPHPPSSLSLSLSLSLFLSFSLSHHSW